MQDMRSIQEYESRAGCYNTPIHNSWEAAREWISAVPNINGAHYRSVGSFIGSAEPDPQDSTLMEVAHSEKAKS